MVTPSVDRSRVNHFHYFKEILRLEPQNTNDFSKNNCENIKESAELTYRRNFVYRVTVLVFYPKALVVKS